MLHWKISGSIWNEGPHRLPCTHLVREDSNEEKVEALAEIICQAGDEAAAALFVLMGTLENAMHPKLLANAAKHFAFARCGESNLYGIVDAQLSLVEGELLANSLLTS